MLAALNRIPNFTQIADNLALGGQAPETHFPILKKIGFCLIVHIEIVGVGSVIEREDLLVTKSEMLYKHIKIDFNNPKKEDFEQLTSILQEYRKLNTFVHCTSGFCSTALIAPFLMQEYNIGLQEALDLGVKWPVPPHWMSILKQFEATPSVD